MSEIVNEMIVAVRGDMSKPLNAVDRLRLYEARVAELDPGDADQILEYMEEAADEIERLRAERQRTSDLIEEVKRVLGPFADIAPSVEYTDFRDGGVVHRQRVTTDGTTDGPLLGWKELTKDHFRAARALLSKLGERT